MCLCTGFSRELFSAQVLSCLTFGTCWRELSFKSGSILTELVITIAGVSAAQQRIPQRVSSDCSTALGACLVIPWMRDPHVLTDTQKS